MIGLVIRWSAANLALIFIATALAGGIGLWSLLHLSVDALPDLSDTQVIVYTEYPGQAPQVVEDQVTFPVTTAMLSVPRSRAVRGFSNFGVSFVYVIFEDGVDIYWARTRVLEALNTATRRLPPTVTPTLGPDASGTGWVYQYAIENAALNLAETRSLQDWVIRYAVAKAPGVAEVASVGGHIKQYNISVDPRRLWALGLSPSFVADTIRQSNQDTGARVVELAETEHAVRSRGYLRGIADIENIVLKSDKFTPVRLGDIASVSLGPDERRGIAELNGLGEVASGIVIQRHGADTVQVIDAAKAALDQLTGALPQGTQLTTVYDRSALIDRAINTLQTTLLEEALIVALICIVFLLHFRSSLVAVIMLPLGLLLAFAGMKALGVSSNIMSLGGLAIAIGAMIDAAIVMVENAHKHIERLTDQKDRSRAIVDAAVEVGPSLFMSLLIITISFLPLFALEGQEARLFTPLAITKTLAMAAAALLSVTLVPALMMICIRGRLRREDENPVNRILEKLYRPILHKALAAPWATIVLAILLSAAAAWPLMRTGSEFMPELNEGTILYMPTALPGLSTTKAAEIAQTQDRIIKAFPEVGSVFAKAGRANSATDPAPLEMFETIINLKPQSEWRQGMTLDKLIGEMDEQLKFPGISNAWTMPIKARIDMLSTGIRTPLGLKILGDNLASIEKACRDIERALRSIPGTSSVYAERVTAGRYLTIEPDRAELARYGLAMADVQRTIGLALGGEVLTTTVEGRERYSVNLRYARDFRDSPQTIAEQVLIHLQNGAAIPLGQIAAVRLESGPATIRTENAKLAAFVYIDTRESDLGGYVADAKAQIAANVALPPGTYAIWSGQFEHLERAQARLQWIVPLTLVLILILLYFVFGRMTEAMIVLTSVPFALIGGLWLTYVMGFNFSVAVAVGFIALAGVAAETGVVMLIYLESALTKHKALSPGTHLPVSTLYEAIMEGAAERLRPKLMTVSAIMLGLAPIMWSSGTGSEIMQRIAVPMLGGMASSTVLTLILIPVIFALVKRRELAEYSRMSHQS